MRRLATVHIAAAALAVLVGLLAGCEGGRTADRTGGSLLTVEEALQVGRAAAPYVETLAGGRFENLPVEAYLRTIGERVARSTPRHELPYQFAVIDSADVRGYALPGGQVYLTRGLLAKLVTESQLAAALAHQLAHISARHVVPALCEACGRGELLDAVAAAESAAAGTAAQPQNEALARLAKAIYEHAYDPDTEAAADRLGLDYLVAAGYNPSGMVTFLEVLARSVRPGDSAVPNVDTESRARRIRKIVERKYRERGGRVADEEYRSEVLDRLKSPLSLRGDARGMP